MSASFLLNGYNLAGYASSMPGLDQARYSAPSDLSFAQVGYSQNLPSYATLAPQSSSPTIFNYFQQAQTAPSSYSPVQQLIQQSNASAKPLITKPLNYQSTSYSPPAPTAAQTNAQQMSWASMMFSTLAAFMNSGSTPTNTTSTNNTTSTANSNTTPQYSGVNGNVANVEYSSGNAIPYNPQNDKDAYGFLRNRGLSPSAYTPEQAEKLARDLGFKPGGSNQATSANTSNTPVQTPSASPAPSTAIPQSTPSAATPQKTGEDESSAEFSAAAQFLRNIGLNPMAYRGNIIGRARELGFAPST